MTIAQLVETLLLNLYGTVTTGGVPMQNLLNFLTIAGLVALIGLAILGWLSLID